jgi:hypothetical protein
MLRITPKEENENKQDDQVLHSGDIVTWEGKERTIVSCDWNENLSKFIIIYLGKSGYCGFLCSPKEYSTLLMSTKQPLVRAPHEASTEGTDSAGT